MIVAKDLDGWAGFAGLRAMRKGFITLGQTRAPHSELWFDRGNLVGIEYVVIAVHHCDLFTDAPSQLADGFNPRSDNRIIQSRPGHLPSLHQPMVNAVSSTILRPSL